MRLFFFLSLLFLFLSCSRKDKNIPQTDSQQVLNFGNNNEIRYYEKIFSKKFGNCNSEDNCASIEIVYPELINGGNGVQKINNSILNQILSLPFNERDYNTLDEIADSLFSDYLDVRRDFPEYNTTWFIKSNSKIFDVMDGIISIRNEIIMFTGGANPFYNITFSNFNLSSGKIVLLDSLLSPKELSQITLIGEELFLKEKGIKKNKSLEDAGYWFDKNKFSLNNNFAITDSGLVFFYNLYEIAPRSNGTTKLFIPKSKLKFLQNIF